MAATPWALADPADYMGERMPYDAFDALPKTQIEVGGGKLDVAFAPGAFALPKEKLLLGSRSRSAQLLSTMAASRSPRLASWSCKYRGTGCAEERPSAIAGRHFALRLAATAPRKTFKPTGRRCTCPAPIYGDFVPTSCGPLRVSLGRLQLVHSRVPCPSSGPDDRQADQE